MDNNKKISLLNEELDDESATYLKETIESWKEEMVAKLQEEVEQAKNAKIEELEEANIAYREELKEEYSDKLFAALEDLRESVKAEATSNVIKNNPELQILEQIKELVAPLLNENYVDDTYSNTIAKLQEELEELRHEKELREGAETLSDLLSPYSKKTQQLVLSLIKEGTPEEVTEQFYNIMESLEEVFVEADDKEKDEESEEGEGEEDNEEDEEENGDEDDEEGDEEDDKDKVEESYIDDDLLSEDTSEEKSKTLASVMKKMARF